MELVNVVCELHSYLKGSEGVFEWYEMGVLGESVNDH
jgi:hypothetical protein